MKAALTNASGASRNAIAKLRTAYPSLPEPYFAFLESSNGAEGDLGAQPGWVVVWPAEEALEATTQYQLPEYLPGYFAFGGNGGGELFVFLIEGTSVDRPVYMVPAIGMAATELQQLAASFEAFKGHIGVVLRADA
jgi:hypothetical protein